MCEVCVQFGLVPSSRANAVMQQTSQAVSSTEYIAALNGGETWSGANGQSATIRYSFSTSTEGGTLLGAAGRTAAQSAMQAWENVANITFSQGTTSDAQLTFSQRNLNSQGAAGYAVTTSSGNRLLSAEVVIDREYTTFPQGEFAYTVMLHEVGHAIGLKHPGNYSTSDSGPFLPTSSDSYDTTVMSYNGGTYLATGAAPVTPMLYDIATVQYLYGANRSYNSGSTTYAMDGSARLLTLWDGGGTDIVTAASGQASVIDLREGEDFGSRTGSTYFWVAFNADIENASGSTRADTVTGNDLANVLYGNGSSDIVDGQEGSDTVFGGVGEFDPTDAGDTLAGGLGNDSIYGNAGNDIIYGGRAQADTADGADLAYGGKGFDSIYGNAGNDTLYGGGAAADPGDESDIIFGGFGADLIFGNGNNDTLYGGGSLADPSDLGDTIYAGMGNDLVYGNGGGDLLMGQEGNDTLHGGVGDDIYSFDSGSGADTILLFEGAGVAGGDLIQLVNNLNASGITSQAAALARTRFADGAAYIDLGNGHTVTILGVSSLVAEDFSIFSF